MEEMENNIYNLCMLLSDDEDRARVEKFFAKRKKREFVRIFQVVLFTLLGVGSVYGVICTVAGHLVPVDKGILLFLSCPTLLFIVVTGIITLFTISDNKKREQLLQEEIGDIRVSDIFVLDTVTTKKDPETGIRNTTIYLTNETTDEEFSFDMKQKNVVYDDLIDKKRYVFHALDEKHIFFLQITEGK